MTEEWHATTQCVNCKETYEYSDMSPDHVKAGYCSRGCAEHKGYFGDAK